MRVWTRICAVTTFLVAGSFGAAFAQPNPSSDDILKSLRGGSGSFTGGTRGIRPTMQQAPDAAPPLPQAQSPSAAVSSPAERRAAAASHRPAAPAPAAQTGQPPSVNLNIPFATGSADLTAAAIRTVNDLGRALANPALTGAHFRIEGHTDTVGSPEANKALSARRAATVVDYLVEHFHLDRDKLEPIGMGEDGLLIATPSNRAEPRNRRVQVVNIGV